MKRVLSVVSAVAALATLSAGTPSEAALAPGLAGAYYSLAPNDINSVDEALALIAGLTPTATFTAHTVCFPTCGGQLSDDESLSTFLGVSSGYVTNLSQDVVGLSYHVLVLTGFIQTDGFYRFNLGSDDGSRLSFSTFDDVSNDGPHAFMSVLGPAVYPAPGLQPITVVQFENWGQTGLTVTHKPFEDYEYYVSEFPFLHVQEPRDAAPEPGTWALLVGGFTLAGAALRRGKAGWARA